MTMAKPLSREAENTTWVDFSWSLFRFFVFWFFSTSHAFTTLFSSKIAELNLEALASQQELQGADQEPSNATEVAQQPNKR